MVFCQPFLWCRAKKTGRKKQLTRAGAEILPAYIHIPTCIHGNNPLKHRFTRASDEGCGHTLKNLNCKDSRHLSCFGCLVVWLFGCYVSYPVLPDQHWPDRFNSSALILEYYLIWISMYITGYEKGNSDNIRAYSRCRI